jgi:hypothetical protein
VTQSHYRALSWYHVIPSALGDERWELRMTVFSLLCAGIVTVLAEKHAHARGLHHPTLMALLAGALVLGAAYLTN